MSQHQDPGNDSSTFLPKATNPDLVSKTGSSLKKKVIKVEDWNGLLMLITYLFLPFNWVINPEVDL